MWGRGTAIVTPDSAIPLLDKYTHSKQFQTGIPADLAHLGHSPKLQTDQGLSTDEPNVACFATDFD